MSKTPSTIATATEKTMTIIVNRIVSEKVGQLTLVNSCLASCQKVCALLNINSHCILKTTKKQGLSQIGFPETIRLHFGYGKICVNMSPVPNKEVVDEN